MRLQDSFAFFADFESASDAEHTETFTCLGVLDLSLSAKSDLIVELAMLGHSEFQLLVLFFSAASFLARFVVRFCQNFCQTTLAWRCDFLIPRYDAISHLLTL